MKILVCSDSHGDLELLRKTELSNPGMDMYLHCGDIGLPGYLTSSFLTVKGNCDHFGDDYPLKRDIPTKWGIIHMEHGDAYGSRSLEHIASLHCFIYLFGHTHEREHGYDGKTWVFNPGSLTSPRDGNQGSYLLISIDDQNGELTFEYKQVFLDM